MRRNVAALCRTSMNEIRYIGPLTADLLRAWEDQGGDALGTDGSEPAVSLIPVEKVVSARLTAPP